MEGKTRRAQQAARKLQKETGMKYTACLRQVIKDQQEKEN